MIDLIHSEGVPGGSLGVSLETLVWHSVLKPRLGKLGSNIHEMLADPVVECATAGSPLGTWTGRAATAGQRPNNALRIYSSCQFHLRS